MPPVLSSAQGVQDSPQIRSKFRATSQRTTKKGERMAWLTLADGTGAVEAAVFPAAYGRNGIASALREGAFLVARGRLAQEEATGTKLFIDEISPMAGAGARLSALSVSVEERRGEPAPWAAQG